MRSSITWNGSLGTATSASWNTKRLAWRTSRPPILTSLTWTLRNDQSFTAAGRANRRRKLPRL